MKNFLFAVGTFLVLIVSWYLLSLRPVDSSAVSDSNIIIESGSSVSEIAGFLTEKRFIRSPLAFKVFVKISGKERDLQAGSFVLSQSMSLSEIVDVLQNGKGQEMTITIPEGFTVKDIDELLAQKGIIEGGEVIDCANNCDFSTFDFLPESTAGLAPRSGKIEGYLYPDTYFVEVSDFHEKFFIERLLGEFRKRVVDAYAADIADSGRTLHQIVTMASLIEEETRTDDERAMVSGILWKRYDEGFGLGVDATVRYILSKPSAEITRADLNVNSPYNTRKFRDLPPGPIANSSLKSIEASIRPQESVYWYYLHGKDGQIRYAESNEEHNINKYKYLRGGQ